jgi:hypothetical protein
VSQVPRFTLAYPKTPGWYLIKYLPEGASHSADQSEDVSLVGDLVTERVLIEERNGHLGFAAAWAPGGYCTVKAFTGWFAGPLE